MKIVIQNNDGENTTIKVDGLFIAIGQEPKNEAFSNLVALNKQGYFEFFISSKAFKAISDFLTYLYSSRSLKHFFLVINCQNTRSIRLAQKLGFHLEGYASEFQFEAQFLPDPYFFHLNYQP